MDSAILPLCAFPPVHWCAIALANPFKIEDNEHYPKQTFRNRYEILSANGRQMLTIPVVGQKGIKTPVREIRISGETWKKNHLSSIRSAYGRSAFYEYYEDELKQLFDKKHSFLFDFNLKCFEWIIQKIPLNEFSFTGHFENWNEEIDFRNQFEPNVVWQVSKGYSQVFSDRFQFEGGLSILDVLFNLGPSASTYIEALDYSGITKVSIK